MDTQRFDHFAKTLSSPGTRRGVLRLVTALPLAGALAGLVPAESEAGRRRRRKAKHRHQTGDAKDNRTGERKKGKGKRKGKRRGTDQGSATGTDQGTATGTGSCTKRSCAPGSCGSQPDGCGGTLTCGCSGNQLCDAGTCQSCGDVCPSGCTHSSVQAAIDDPNGPSTIRLCAGTYVGNLTITRNVTLIGAGDGDDPATNTILDAAGSGRVVHIERRTPQPVAVTLQNLRITGGAVPSNGGGGILNDKGTLRLIDTTVTGNTAALGGGIRNGAGTLTLIASTVTSNTASDTSGGGIDNSDSTVTIDADSQVTFNRARVVGGGIANHEGTVTLASDQIVANNCPDNCLGSISDVTGDTIPVDNCAATPVSC